MKLSYTVTGEKYDTGKSERADAGGCTCFAEEMLLIVNVLKIHDSDIAGK